MAPGPSSASSLRLMTTLLAASSSRTAPRLLRPPMAMRSSAAVRAFSSGSSSRGGGDGGSSVSASVRFLKSGLQGCRPPQQSQQLWATPNTLSLSSRLILQARLAHSSATASASAASPTSQPSPASPTASSNPSGNRGPPPPQRPLPTLPPASRRPLIALTLLVLSLLSWTTFTSLAMNDERANSSAFRSALNVVRASPRVRDLLRVKEEEGETVTTKKEWWLAPYGGGVWVGGSVNMMQGKCDVMFRVGVNSKRADAGQGETATVYFTSIRRSQVGTFENLRFLVVRDSDGERISLLPEHGGP